MLSAPSQLLMRNQSLLEQGQWLLVNPADAQIFAELSDTIDSAALFGFHQYFDVYQQAISQHNPAQHHFAADYPAGKLFDGAVLYMPKAKEQAKMLLANIAACIKPGGQIVLIGENKGGIKSAAKLLDTYSEQVNKLDSARHCSIYCAQVAETARPFVLGDWLSEHKIDVAGIEFTLASLPGVFSHGELDQGTRLLLDSITHVPTGMVLDFACGAGVIGCFLGLKNPQADVSMCDISALAIYCSKYNAKANGIKAKVLASNGLQELPKGFRGIFTNPPFHSGVKTDYSVTERFISQAKAHMAVGGGLTMVANNFLKYPPLLEKHMGKVTVQAQTTKFSLYRCKKN